MHDDLINVDNYISDEYSICREERQYALYLSNVLRYYNNRKKRVNIDQEKLKTIFEACGLGLDKKVVYVFYETTFMRDIFERNRRRYLSKKADSKKQKDVYLQKTFTPSSYVIEETNGSFNRNLLTFCWDKIIKTKTENKDINFSNTPILEVNYGSNDIPDEYSKIKNLTRAMMNSKPDLAVVYYDNNMKDKKKLLFLECKFDSSEDKIDGDDGEKLPQTRIQGYIAEFLCKYYFTNLSVSEVMDNEHGKSKIVKFSRSGESGTIKISNLIELEKRIFK